MKKKILILFGIIISILFFNNVYGITYYKVHQDKTLTYVTALNEDEAKKRKEFYNTQLSDNIYLNPSIPNYLAFINLKPTLKYYRHGIFIETIGGLRAYCLDPGLNVDQEYYIESSPKTQYSNLSEANKFYTKLYKADFSNIKFYYEVGTGSIPITVTGEDMEYIIKQTLFWAYSAGSLSEHAGQIFVKGETNGDEYYFNLLMKDIANSLLHYWQLYSNSDNWKNVGDNSCNVNYYNVLVNNKESLKEILRRINTVSVGNDENVTVVTYLPKNGNTSYQRFVGIKTDNPPATNKNYAVVYNLNGSISGDTTFHTLNNDLGITGSYNGYQCTGYRIYKSPYDYGGTPSNVIKNTIVDSSGSSATATLKYSNADAYNVIEFLFEEKKHTLTVERYINGTMVKNDEKYSDLKEGSYQNISLDFLYNSIQYYDLYVENSDNLSKDNNHNISYTMGTSDHTIKIYYQYGQVTIKKIIRDNNGIESENSSETKDLTSDQTIGIPSYVGSNRYFKYVSGSTTKYWNDSGYTEGSNITVPKGKNNVTIKLYYGKRLLYYSHVLKSGTSYRSLEDGSKTYYSWGEQQNAVSAKSIPWYVSLNSTYLKLKYVSGKYLNGNDSDNITTANLRNSGTAFLMSTFGLGAMAQERATDTTRVEFYYEVNPSVKVVVRHFTKNANGTYSLNNTLANENAVVLNSEAYNGVGANSYVIVQNGYSQRKSIYRNTMITLDDGEKAKLISFSYSELYEIDKNDKILIDRSRTFMLDGVYYNCIGFKVKKSDDSTPLEINGSGVNTTSSLQQVVKGDSEYVFVDYYYDPEDYSTVVSKTPDDPNNPDDPGNDDGNKNGYKGIGDSARLRFSPLFANGYTSLGNAVIMGDGTSENKNIAYVPVTENLKPYVVTDICRVRTAKYSISLVNQKLQYGVSTYQAWGVSYDGDMSEVRDIVGNEVEKVYNDITKMSISDNKKSEITNYIKGTVNVIKDSLGILFNSNVENSDKNFTNRLDKISKEQINTDSYYNNSGIYNVPNTKYNGERQPSGMIKYNIYTVNSSNDITNVYHDDKSDNSKITKANSMKVNIYTPVATGDIAIKSIDFVNHSDVNSDTIGIIQQGVEFSVTVSTQKDKSYGNVYGNIKNTGKYVKYWYLMFDFDVTYNGRTYKANEEWIQVPANNGSKYAETVITGLQATTGSTDMATIKSSLNHIKAIASTLNLPSDNFANEQLSKTTSTKKDISTTPYINSKFISLNNNSSSQGLGMTKDSYYLVSDIQETTSIGRIFDFEITDCLDVNYKDVFRNINSDDNTVNSLTGTRYFAGIRRLVALDSVTSTTTNTLLNRSNLVVGSVTKVLPLGPYKHTTNSYIKSVKLGYRFSFDVKTSGYYDVNDDNVERSVKVTPSYYYISKDGKTYNDNIKLYYKNSSGNYVDFESSNYTIYYKPNDGYRNTYNSGAYNEGVAVDKDSIVDRTTLTTSLTGLNISKAFTLSSDKSMTTSDYKYLQAWYGEFKIPNSTVALAVNGDGKVDINNPLKDGYIGVKFKMECIDKYSSNKVVTISYDANDTGLYAGKENTSQWDFEGYLGFKESNIGSPLSSPLQIQLENGVWNITDNDTYNKVKGTIIFYDLDDRAANDYD